MLINNHVKTQLWSNTATYSTPGPIKNNLAIEVDSRSAKQSDCLGSNPGSGITLHVYPGEVFNPSVPHFSQL